MLFNSFVFIFGFLPIALFLVWAVAGRGALTKWTLTALSLFFYAWWNPKYLPLLAFSICFNYWVGTQIERCCENGQRRSSNMWTAFGVSVDLAMLGYFKYANFALDNANLLLGTNYEIGRIALPLAISFYTFQKIAYLIDIRRGEARKTGFTDFALFAAFFPQLIAGPIVHYSEIIPQLKSRAFGFIRSKNLMIGLVIFSIGLFKKTVLADTLSAYANPLFNEVSGREIDFVGGWVAAVTFTLQLYFDFSGYSDMAIGLGRMFGVKLPLNFHSPLRATGIIDYWRRWHMTLQRFIVSYIFQPLSLPLNRYAAEKRLTGWSQFAVGIGIPTFITFVAVGIWHGAGWTFVLFGVLHAGYICINEVWRENQKHRRRRRKKQGLPIREASALQIAGYQAVTLCAIAFGNVLFRAASVSDAMEIWHGMAGLSGITAAGWSTLGLGVLAYSAIGILIVALFPNTQQLMRNYDPAYNWDEWKGVSPPRISLVWRPDIKGLIFGALALLLGILFIQRGQAIFLYFNF
ncbi:putative O-acyltransferase [Sphingomonas changbaiensis NBRC 104936]|uniref:Probable alginate O-acetylase AlgI n=1 Tax=Sphingomonas changbaiensis NBRC 104936 TaxID=1219043 RepID=A0A0E9MMJ6_9SPHN|nr:MBOAT family O-acyltransferase [Sphingomonas changbaiensis]GAO38733.1 putative O-acyltransferase [Sphingomonas changbaiensis NBRC 104936]